MKYENELINKVEMKKLI